MIARLHLKQSLKPCMIWCATLCIMIFGFMAIYPSMAQDAMTQLAHSMMADLPDALMAVIGFDAIPNFSDINVFYGYIMQYMNLAFAVYAASLGLSSYLSEAKNGTIEFLYAQPISRTDLIGGKLLANTLLVTSLWGLMTATSIVSIAVFKPETQHLMDILTHLSPIFLSILGAGLILLILASALSLLLPSNVNPTSVSIALVFTLYLLGVVGQLLPTLNWMHDISLLSIVNPNTVLNHGLNIPMLFIWFVLSAGLLVYAKHAFQHRDINI